MKGCPFDVPRTSTSMAVSELAMMSETARLDRSAVLL
jgi:hypothetical protein